MNVIAKYGKSFLGDTVNYLLGRSSHPNGYLPFQPEPVRELMNRVAGMFNRGEMEKRVNAARENASRAGFEIPRDDGFKVFPPGGLAGADELIGSITKRMETEDIAAHMANSKNPYSKDYLLMYFVDRKTLELDSPFLKLALRDDILAAVSNYFGFVPIVNYVDIWYSRPNESTQFKGSQLYHCDWEDLTKMRIFLFCNDVDGQSGPLTAISAKKSKEIRDAIDYRWGTRVGDDAINAHIKEGEAIPLAGPKGTVGFADASRCFHYGSRVQTKIRIMGMIHYITPFAFDLKRPFARLAHSGLPEMQRLALGAR
ncbi:MAG: hypothetical protein HZB29_01285 [Nitrospinae bacterium]|nr:hypothetical protein [Nitrospinota bacterium]